ncbi:uncharacterized protein IL334_003169 [Kwoniella shivajii]|uniref:Uncharacterized protein n=1 Tax=Kwoniella shivajii TaxID=564305 RepID=A0ABZ1CZS8_9TREE|nr:hypothetical protein IL334_003169 [Kwoniella shivajii]
MSSNDNNDKARIDGDQRNGAKDDDNPADSFPESGKLNVPTVPSDLGGGSWVVINAHQGPRTNLANVCSNGDASVNGTAGQGK